MNPYSELTERQIVILRAFEDANARGPFSAVSLHDLGLQRDDDLEVLLGLHVVRRTSSDTERFYAPLSRAVFTPAIPRRVQVVLLITVIAAVVIGLAALVLGRIR
ncbi:MAG: hypothetical protein ABJE10_17355 [bacterium]